MIVTNKLGLPSPVVRAVTPKRDPHARRGGADISVTELIGPPRIMQLRERYWDQITEDASDLLFALYGTIGHDILSRNAEAGKLTEQRLRIRVTHNGRPWVISGQFDLVDDDDGVRVLTDYKFASAWTFIFGKPEWEQQLNIYRLMLQETGNGTVQRLQNVLLFRDWQKREAERNNEYPRGRAAVINQPMWSDERTMEFIHERLEAHSHERPECTDEERMVKPESVAVMKQGGKRAMRVFEVDPKNPQAAAAQAQSFILHETAQNPELKLEAVVRRTDPLRCTNFCSVWKWCEFGRQVHGFEEDEPD